MSESGLRDIKVPDIGDFKDVEIIEVHARAGEIIAAEDPLITLETDKAAMDVPAPAGEAQGSQGQRGRPCLGGRHSRSA